MIEVTIDGATNEKTKKSGAGISIKSASERFDYSVSLPYMSNHDAEFMSLIHALEICKKHFPGQMIAIESDSQLVVDAINHSYVRNKQFKPYLAKYNGLIDVFPYIFIKWIPEKQNKKADLLAKKALQQ